MRFPILRPRSASDDLEKVVARFLSAEAAEGPGSDVAADAALAALMRGLPSPRPGRGFARNVVRAAYGAPAAPGWRRAGLAAAGVTATATLASGFVAVLAALGLLDPVARLSAAARGLVSVAGRLDEAVSLVRVAFLVRDALLTVVAETPAGPLLLAAVVVSGLVLRRLTGPGPDRSSAYA